MAQANLPVLPQISAALAAPPAKPRATADTAGDEQAFAKVLDKHLKPQESPKPPKPEQEAKAADSATDPAPPTPADPKTAVSHAAADPILLPADALSRLSTAPEEPDLAADSDPAAAEENPLQASLAGLPAALAALLAGAPGAPAAAASPPLPADKPALAATAALPPGSDAIAATLARMLAETAGSRAEAPAQALAGELLRQAAPVEGGEVPAAAPSASLAAEDPSAFAAALGKATGRDDKPAVLPAVDTETGPASRAAETAQLAANPAAGDAGARPETNPAAALAWATAPGRVHHEDGGPRLIVPQPPDHPAWAESVGSKVTWLVGQGESSAELVLTPPQLGRVEVSLSVSGDQTTAQFVAATPAAREALEQALPRLREVLAEAGIQLTQSGVSTSDQQGERGEGTRQGPRRHEGGGAPGGELEISARPWQRRGEGLVDTFA